MGHPPENDIRIYRNQGLQAQRTGRIDTTRAGCHPAQSIAGGKPFAAHIQSPVGEEMEFFRTRPLSSRRIQPLRKYVPVAQQHQKR